MPKLNCESASAMFPSEITFCLLTNKFGILRQARNNKKRLQTIYETGNLRQTAYLLQIELL